jgi:hypothetical protein
MALETISVTMAVHRDTMMALTQREIGWRLFQEWLPPIFLPFEARGFVGDRSIDLRAPAARTTWRGVPLWPGETIAEPFPLSSIAPGEEVTAQSLMEFAPDGDKAWECTLVGALHHRPPIPGARDGWYGRIVWTEPNVAEGRLIYIVRVAIEFSPAQRVVSIGFPFAGYPLTSHAPQLSADAHILPATAPEAVKENRAALMRAIARARMLLGLQPDEVTWTINAEEALLAPDRQALAQWQGALQRGETIQE